VDKPALKTENEKGRLKITFETASMYCPAGNGQNADQVKWLGIV
jgi:hypothetical protein